MSGNSSVGIRGGGSGYFPIDISDVTDIPVSRNNRLEFMPSGVQSYEKRWALLDAAERAIHIATFSIMNDGTSDRMVAVLCEKLRHGVEVKIILDDIVNRTTFAGKKLAQLETAGAEIIRYNGLFDGWSVSSGKPRPLHGLVVNAKLKLKQHFHEKYMIVDGAKCILGGINWGDKYAFGGKETKAWRDTDVYLEGAAVEDIQFQFLKDFARYRGWNEAYAKDRGLAYDDYARSTTPAAKADIRRARPELFPGPASNGPYDLRYIAHKPHDDGVLPMTNIYLSLISKAEDYILWGCHGIRPPRIYGEYFAAAVARGVNVSIITNSKVSAQTLMVNGLLGWMYWECTTHYKWLLERGVRIFEWQKPGAFHSKNFVMDGRVCSVGSYNIARGSAYHHSESNLLIEGADFAAQIEKQFQVDLGDCKEVTLKDFSPPADDAFKRPLSERDLLVKPSLIPPDIAAELAAGKYTRVLT